MGSTETLPHFLILSSIFFFCSSSMTIPPVPVPNLAARAAFFAASSLSFCFLLAVSLSPNLAALFFRSASCVSLNGIPNLSDLFLLLASSSVSVGPAPASSVFSSSAAAAAGASAGFSSAAGSAAGSAAFSSAGAAASGSCTGSASGSGSGAGSAALAASESRYSCRRCINTALFPLVASPSFDSSPRSSTTLHFCKGLSDIFPFRESRGERV
mmetsp:Transcript_10854/g.19854  ORF Transcript_10854/g.19854 Transcript_10854/m.19854 type:complete len:213 (+) Transcript_10854:383-1021(+)